MDDVAGGDGVSGVDFSDEKKAGAWLETQSVEVRSAIASRAALRVCGSISMTPKGSLSSIAILVLRATISSVIRSTGRKADFTWRSGLSAKLSEKLTAGTPAYCAARSAALSTTDTAYSTFHSTAYSAATIAQFS